VEIKQIMEATSKRKEEAQADKVDRLDNPQMALETVAEGPGLVVRAQEALGLVAEERCDAVQWSC
jgi:hypothetical protein